LPAEFETVKSEVEVSRPVFIL